VIIRDPCYLQFTEWLITQLPKNNTQTYVLGINGAPGSGKSTLAELLSEFLASEHGLQVVILSIDDIYLTRGERESLGQRVHPLLSTRGVPGTHDVALGISVIEKLCSLRPGESLNVPRFDKSRDDRRSSSDWPTVTGPVDLVIFEGWCVASEAMTADELKEPLNELESAADSDGQWRSYANDKLRTDYGQLFALLDSLLFLQAPNFDAVLRWRLEQEHKLLESAAADADAIMSDQQVASFIQLYERISRHNIASMPSIADAVIELGDDHQAKSLAFRRSETLNEV
jgi:D-glycerate 3-kinase